MCFFFLRQVSFSLVLALQNECTSIVNIYLSHLIPTFPECAHQTFIFNGRCFNTCPERSFIVPEKVSENVQQSKGLSVKKRRHAMNIDEFDSLDDIIGRSKNAVGNRDVTESSTTLPQKLCGSCHEVCLKCNGPTENDCLTCDSDFNQIIIGSRVMCRKKANGDIYESSTSAAVVLNNGNKSVLNGITNQLKNYSIEKIVLVSSAIGILLMIFMICMYIMLIKCDCGVLSSLYNKTKQFLLNRASSGNASGNEREKYSYNIVEMEERSPLTTVQDTQTNGEEEEDSDISES